ncbi:MAG: A24 family peptidase, partial [Mycobacterium sp.]|nr:A24 family peptidase [Mycobacterium sp.]
MGVVWAVAGAAVLGWAVALSVVDLRERRLPNVLTLSGAAVITAGAAVAGRGTAALLGGLALSALYLVVHLAAPSGLGAGDVKLALALGAL